MIARQRSSRGRALLLTAAVIAATAVAAVWFSGCSSKSVGEVLVAAGHGGGGSGGGGTTSGVNQNTVIKGTFTDSRNSRTYKTVKIGNQRWMAENLNYQTTDSWCYDGYDGSTANCDKYGRLYTWSAAKTACPRGWHLPSRIEWDKLVTATGGYSTAGRKLKSTSGWNYNGNGTDTYGFSALPGGCSCYSGGRFGDVGLSGYWWMDTENDGARAYYRYMDYNNDYVGEHDDNKSTGFSVRCVEE